MPFYARPSLDNVSTRIYARIYTRETVVTRVVPLAIPGPDGQTPGVHPVARIFLSHGPAAVTRFLSGQSLLISPRSFIVQSSVTTKHRVVVLFFPSFLPSFLSFSLLQFYPISSQEEDILVVSPTNPTSWNHGDRVNPLAATSVAWLSSLIDYTTCFELQLWGFSMVTIHGRGRSIVSRVCFQPFRVLRREYFKPIAKNE